MIKGLITQDVYLGTTKIFIDIFLSKVQRKWGGSIGYNSYCKFVKITSIPTADVSFLRTAKTKKLKLFFVTHEMCAKGNLLLIKLRILRFYVRPWPLLTLSYTLYLSYATLSTPFSIYSWTQFSTLGALDPRLKPIQIPFPTPKRPYQKQLLQINSPPPPARDLPAW